MKLYRSEDIGPNDTCLWVRLVDVNARIAALESQLAQYRWRRVEEEMPEAWASVLIPYALGTVEAFVDNNGLWWEARANDRVWGVRHWMPLPPTPEEGE